MIVDVLHHKEAEACPVLSKTARPTRQKIQRANGAVLNVYILYQYNWDRVVGCVYRERGEGGFQWTKLAKS